MYITITAQKLSDGFFQSVKDYVDYLELEYIFNQYGNKIEPKEVIKEIDSNGGKLKKTEPKFYSITVSPSKYKLGSLTNTAGDLKKYTRDLMKD